MLSKETLVELLNDSDSHDIITRGYGKTKSLVLEGYTVSHVERHGGREGAGEEHWVVFSVEKDGAKEHWEIPGWYQSHNGAELEIGNMFQVAPEEITVIRWKALK